MLAGALTLTLISLHLTPSVLAGAIELTVGLVDLLCSDKRLNLPMGALAAGALGDNVRLHAIASVVVVVICGGGGGYLWC